MADVLDIRDQELKILREQNELLNAFLFSNMYIDIAKELKKDLGMFSERYMDRAKVTIYEKAYEEVENMLSSSDKRYVEYRKHVLELWEECKKIVL